MPKVRADLSEAPTGGGQFNKRHVEEGEYLLRIKSSKVVEIKSGDNAGKEQVLFTIVSPQIPGAVYPYYVPLSGKRAWLFRQIVEVCGVDTKGAKIVSFDTDKLNGKEFGAFLAEDEYQGTLQSVIDRIFPKEELEDYDAPAEAEVTEDAPAEVTHRTGRNKPVAKKTPAPSVEDTDAGSDEVDLDNI